MSFGVWADAHDDARLALFARHGFAYARTFFRMEASLADPVPRPRWPRGLVVRAFRAGRDDTVVYAAMKEAFQDEFRPMAISLDEWRRLRFSRADLDLGLWSVAWDEDAVAGATLSFAQPGGGLIDELFVQPAWRRRGLGRALLLHAFAALRRRGLRRAYLGVDSANPTGAMELYESAGMRPTREHAFFDKDVVASG